MAFIDRIKDRARQDVKKIVMPESNDRRTLIAAHKILKENIADIIMVGKEEKIMEGANWLELDLSRISVVDPETSDKFELYADTLYELRKNKGMTPEKARERLLSDYLMWGVMMVKMKDADGMVAGACHATADVLRPSLQVLKTAPGVELVSGFFILDVPDCIFGENGTVKIGGTSTNNIDVWDFADETDQDTENKGLKEATSNVYGNGHTSLYADVIDAIQNDRDPYVDAVAGRNAVEMILAIYQSAATDKPVKLPLENVASTDFEGRFDR